jgi:hypothetical protein
MVKWIGMKVTYLLIGSDNDGNETEQIDEYLVEKRI